ncbi:hypothetical protein SAMN02949497_4269 [Methylomagnum ishizawai]|uniref:Phosphatase n=1 Tax=Methylomagnum ishizawai TaxID=1760988 RepID=A0A1Y6DB38_9GAMM|nr:alkaline phosphatase PhoX [Methylomagnum ishizawai]SMF96855.1 hypothetical protein SAMN02949497_4269 [Methylomagnum ishizawai]
MKAITIRVAIAAALASGVALPNLASAFDFGKYVETQMANRAPALFGVNAPLASTAPVTPSTGYRNPSQSAADQIAAADGLTVEYVTRNAANHTDMMAFWPNDKAPSHLITCVESDLETLPNGKMNPSVQRINLITGQVDTLLRGMDGCDGIRRTPWGTILATEETDDGGAYEIIKPLATTENTVTNRAAGTISGPTAGNIVKRTALPTMAWEGLAVLPTGVIIAGDELRPGTAAPDVDGGAIFKFIPTAPRGVVGNIADLNDSPLVDGKVYAMQVSCTTGTQFGQGCEIGNAGWIEVAAANARGEADTKGATGYYRPEDLHQDIRYSNPSVPAAVRVCWTDTGNEGGKNYSEVVCAVDSNPLNTTGRTTVVNRFVEGDTDFNSFDNLDFQPRTGNLYVVEDHDNGDIFACLPDGADRDIKTDGCAKILSVKDTKAEPTGFIFIGDGSTAFVSIQHSDDTNMPAYDGFGTDDLIKITGFKVPGLR